MGLHLGRLITGGEGPLKCGFLWYTNMVLWGLTIYVIVFSLLQKNGLNNQSIVLCHLYVTSSAI